MSHKQKLLQSRLTTSTCEHTNRTGQQKHFLLSKALKGLVKVRGTGYPDTNFVSTLFTPLYTQLPGLYSFLENNAMPHSKFVCETLLCEG